MHALRTRTLWALLLLAPGCQLRDQPAMPTLSSQPWGRTPDGADVTLYTLRNAHGPRADIATYGGIVTRLEVPDREGRMAHRAGLRFAGGLPRGVAVLRRH